MLNVDYLLQMVDNNAFRDPSKGDIRPAVRARLFQGDANIAQALFVGDVAHEAADKRGL
jgi:hypothetical protein